jgi:iron complex transport system substrate-binding protein
VIVDVNVAGALWDFGVRPVGVFGWNITGENTVGPAGGNLDTSTVEFLNGPSTTIDAERAIAAQPDLIVSLYFGPEFGVWSILPEETERIEQIAPIVAISGTSRADIALGRFAELAGALGIDLESEEIAAQRATYETSIARLKGVLSVKTGMSAVFVATDTDSVWVANPAAAGDVMFFRELGLDVPGLPVSDAEYWQQLSFEEVAIYPTDLFFYSLRGVINTKEGILEHPTMGLLPSAKAGQVFPWNQDVILNYPGLAGILDGISTAVETSDENTV